MSDSESDSEPNVGVTEVLLGYAGKPTAHEILSPLDNFIGGAPVWFDNVPPSNELLKCQECSNELDLLAQLSCPLHGKHYDRAIYIFLCHNPDCRRKEGAARCIRGIHTNDEITSRHVKESQRDEIDALISAPEAKIGDTIFSGSSSEPASNPFASGVPTFTASSSTKTVPPLETKKNKKSSKTSEIGKPVGRYPCKIIDVEEEYLTPDKSLADIKYEPEAVEPEDQAQAEASGSKEELDPSIAAIASAVSDPVFLKFVELVDHNPEQVLRYEKGLKVVPFRNDSLFSVFADPTKLPESREFEVQLMPHLISELETADMIADGMEWGTIAIATSINDELPEVNEQGIGYTEEWVGVQWEGADIQT